MKKLLLIVAVLFAASMGRNTLHAADFYEIHETTATDAAFTVFTGAGFLHKVIVSSAGVGSFLTISDTTENTMGTTTIGLETATLGEYVFDIGISSGLTYLIDTNTSAAALSFLYRRGSFFPADGQIWRSHFTITAQTDNNIFNGAGVLHKIILSSATAVAAGIDIHDSSADDVGGSNQKTRVDGAVASDDTYDIFLSSGLTYTTTGTAGWNIIYKSRF